MSCYGQNISLRPTQRRRTRSASRRHRAAAPVLCLDGLGTNVGLKRMCSGGGDDGYSVSPWPNREDPWLPAGARLLLIAASAATHIALREAAQGDPGVLEKSAELR